jgi:hypothetical protein
MRKPCLVGTLSIHWVELVMRWLVYPESRMAFSGGVGARVLSVILQWCSSTLVVVPATC